MGKVGRFLCDPIRAIQCALAERRSKQDEKKGTSWKLLICTVHDANICCRAGVVLIDAFSMRIVFLVLFFHGLFS